MIMRSIAISIAMLLLAACSSANDPKDKLPAGYAGPIAHKNSDIYLVKQEPINYQGKKDLVQIRIVISLHNENRVKNAKLKSISSIHVYDCRKKNKYMDIPEGFYSNKYAIGSPVIPSPKRIGSWSIAKDNTLDNIIWKYLCHISMTADSVKGL